MEAFGYGVSEAATARTVVESQVVWAPVQRSPTADRPVDATIELIAHWARQRTRQSEMLVSFACKVYEAAVIDYARRGGQLKASAC